MFNIGFSELVLIGIIALVFIGPKQIPEVARVVGGFLRDIKRASNEFQKQINLPTSHVDKIKDELSNRVQKVLDETPQKTPSEQPAPDGAISKVASSKPGDESNE